MRVAGAVPRVFDALAPTDPGLEPGTWYRATGLCDGQPFAVPDFAVFAYLPPPWAARPHSCGLAYGPDQAWACERALFECIERDAESRLMCQLSTEQTPTATPIDPASVSPQAAAALDKLEQSGFRTLLWDITGDVRVPTALAVVRWLEGQGRWVHQGTGCARSLEHAVDRALLEAIQSRSVDVQGARADFVDDPDDQPVHPWYLHGGPTRPVQPVLGVPGSIDAIARAVEEVTGHQPMWVDVTAPGLHGVAVRVIAPGLELAPADPERIGRRARAWLGMA